MSTISCNVCVESFNKTNRYKIECKCGFECCRACAKVYLLSSSEDAHCMSCKVSWDRRFLMNNFEKNFMSKIYKEYRQNILFDKEIALLPMTQPQVEKIITKKKLLEDAVNIMKEMYDMSNFSTNKLNLKHIIEGFYNFPSDFQIKKWDIQGRLIVVNEELNKLNNKASVDVDNDKAKFIRQCPNNDCHGFLTSSLKCNLCSSWACAECHEIKGDSKNSDHTCNKEILESIKMLRKDTKSCPKCSVSIFKIEGCDQIFCVECHTAFSWNTLKIDNGAIHNPHYFEYLAKKNGSVERNPMDIICGREIDNYFVNELIREMTGKVDYVFQDQISKICINIIHIRYVEFRKFTQDRIMDNMDIRIKYMMNEITKDKFKSILQRREKNHAKNNEILNVLITFVNCITEIIHRYYNSMIHHETYYDTITPKIYNEIVNLTTHMNECFKEISETYKCKLHEINLNGNKYYIFN